MWNNQINATVNLTFYLKVKNLQQLRDCYYSAKRLKKMKVLARMGESVRFTEK